MQRIRTTQNTLGKINSWQSGKLEPNEVIDIPEGEEFRLVGEDAGHYVVELRIFKGHTEVVEGDRTVINPPRINQDGLDLIKEFEGLELEAYLCPAQVWTIGFGSTDGVQPGMIISKEGAEKLLRKDLERFEKCVFQEVKVELNSNQFSALVSFAFNAGRGAFKTSTLLKKLNQRDYAGSANEFERWIWAKGKVLEGLIRRREAERELFLKPE